MDISILPADMYIVVNKTVLQENEIGRAHV